MGKSRGSSGPPATQTVTQRVDIPDFLRPFVQRQAEIGTDALGRLPDLLGQGERLTAPLDPLELQAQQMQLAAAQGFDPTGSINASRGALQGAASGDFLFGGAGFDQAVDAAVRAAQPHILSAFGGAGRGRSGLAQAAIGRQATDAFANMFGQERQRQMAAASILPQFEAGALGLQLSPADIFGAVGGQRRGQALQEQLAPITAQEAILQAAGGGVPLGALLGQTQSGISTQPMFQNRGAGLLGGGLAGAGIGTALGFSNPFTLGAFALGGGLLGGL